MPTQIDTFQWSAQNRTTTYPFVPSATLQTRTGKSLVEGVILDAALYPVGGTAGLYLTSVTIDRDGITFLVGTDGVPRLCSGRYVLAAPSDSVTLTDGFGRAAGMLLSADNQLATILPWGVGEHRFTRAATEFAASVCAPTPELGVRAIVLEDGTLLAGDVWLLGADGVVLTAGSAVIPGPSGELPVAIRTIKVDIVGDPLFRRRLCGGGAFAGGRFISAVRFLSPDGTPTDVVPDADGNISLIATHVDTEDTVLRITATADGIGIGAAGTTLGG